MSNIPERGNPCQLWPSSARNGAAEPPALRREAGPRRGTAAVRLPRRLGARGYAATVRARLLRVRTRVLRSASRGMRAAQAALPFGVLHLPSNHKNQLVLRVDVQFRVDVAHMAFCGGRADDKRFGNAFCRHALG